MVHAGSLTDLWVQLNPCRTNANVSQLQPAVKKFHDNKQTCLLSTSLHRNGSAISHKMITKRPWFKSCLRTLRFVISFSFALHFNNKKGLG